MTAPIESPFRRQIRERVLVLDGGLASELEHRGAELDDHLWSARLLESAPARIVEVHEAYARAGADVLTTASYQASLAGFARAGVDEGRALALMASSVTLARAGAERAGGGDVLIAGSCGTWGAHLGDGSEYRGRYAASDDELYAFHAPRARALLDAGADVLAFETFPDAREALLCARLADELGADAWLSFSCADGKTTAGGDDLAATARALHDAEHIVAIGVNCIPPALVDEALSCIASATTKPLVAYPNRGEAWDPEARCWVATDAPPDLHARATTWIERGARLIGGCCRTRPEDIRELSLTTASPRE
jgi:homocysteine S-methyltransferase